MFDEQLDPFVEDAFQEAIAAAQAAGRDGGIDDLVLLELLLRDPDENVLRALGSRVRSLHKQVAAAREDADGAPGQYRPLPDAEDLVRFAAMEAMELGGYGVSVGAIHVLLALFAFQGARGEEVLRESGVDWRPLRSIVRRLGLGW